MTGTTTIFLCGDVMTGRGIDQILPHPNGPAIHEPFMTSALDYVQLAESVDGAIPRPADFTWCTLLFPAGLKPGFHSPSGKAKTPDIFGTSWAGEG